MGPAPEPLLIATAPGGRLFTGAVGSAVAPAFTVALMAVLAAGRSRPERGPEGELLVTADLAAGGLRFEAAVGAGAGSLHARLDLPLRSLRVDDWVTGSATPVADDDLRSALARRRPAADLPLTVGAGDGPVAPVRPPLTVAAGLEEVAALSRGQAMSLLRALPRGPAGMTVWALPTARSLLLGAVAHPEAVGVPGAARLTVLRPLARHATGMRVLAAATGAAGAASAWELSAPGLRLTITLNAAPQAPPQSWMLANTTTLSR